MLTRAVAVLLLLALPSSSFGQYVTAHDLNRARASLIGPSLTLHLDPLSAAHAPALQADVCDAARKQGRSDAREHHNAAPWLATAAAGFFLPILGIGLATAIASGPKPEPKTIAANVDADCYRDGYRRGARKKNMITALTASSLGTVAVIALLAASGGPAFFPSGPSANLHSQPVAR